MPTPLTGPAVVELDIAPGPDKADVIKEAARLIASDGRADQAGLAQALADREAQIATGLPGGIAIPHCRDAAVTQATVGFLRLSHPVDFGADDGPADLIVVLAGPDESGSEHMKLLAQLSRALVRPEFVAALRAATTPADAAALLDDALHAGQPAAAAPAAAAPAAPKRLVAITSCPTGIAHTYMAAESLEKAAQARGIDLQVETQGSGGIEPLKRSVIQNAQALIISADIDVTGRDRFVGLPIVESSVNKAISDPDALLDQALAAIDNPNARKVTASGRGESVTAGADEARVGWGRRIYQSVLTGVSYMIPFVAAGGLIMAISFLIGGYDVAFVSSNVATHYSLWNLPDIQHYVSAAGEHLVTNRDGLALYLGAVLNALGGTAMGFLVAALSAYIAFGMAGRPGIAPGFVGGAVSVTVGAGFLGGLITGILAGLIAAWLSSYKPPRWLAGLMPVVIIPLIDTLIVGGLMYLLLGRPLATLMNWLQSELNGMTGTSEVLLGIIIGLMMCFDLGGPVNKAAYLFATAGLSAATPAAWHIMAAVMAAGMVPPIAMALSTVVRPKLYNETEKENGKAAWLLGASFISEGAIPFAAADPLRCIPSNMIGGAVCGALCMAIGVESRAPHGGIFVLFAITPIWGFLLALVAGVVVTCALVTALKSLKKSPILEVG